MNNNNSQSKEGINKIVAIARNVPTERKMAVRRFSTNQASLQDAAAVIHVPEGRLYNDFSTNQASLQDAASVILVPEGCLDDDFCAPHVSLRDAASAILVPEGRLVGSIDAKPRLSVPSERLVRRELHQPTGYKRAGKFIALVFLIIALFTACKQKSQQVAKVQGKAYYTCSMHPQIHEDHPGNCPICSMKLIKVELTGAVDKISDNITLTATQLQLANIKTDIVRDENTGSEKTLTGTVTTDENKSEELSARIAGRIQQLFVRTTGEKIAVGQPLYSIYSEDLQEAEKEYLLAKQQQKMLHNPDVDYQQLISAAESKLQLWGLSHSQISNLAASGKASATTTILSKVNGTVSDIAVHEGDYVTEGMTILKAQALNTLWVQAQLYANEAGNYKENDPVHVSFPDLGGQVINGKVEFINPELSDDSKVVLIRISIPNQQGLIQPGMLAYISIAGGGKRVLAVPAPAILTDGKGSKVWIKNSDGSFSPRMIKTGTGNESYVPVLSGLSAGDIMVTNGAYLLNSEYVFKIGADKTSMRGMKM